MTMRVAAGDRKGAVETFQSSLVLLSVVSLCIGLIVSVGVWHGVLAPLGKVGNRADARALLGRESALAVYVLISQQFGVLESGFRCDGNFATGTMGGQLLRIAEVGSGTVVGMMTGSLVWVAATYLMVRIVGNASYAWFLHKKSSLDFHRLSLPRFPESRNLRRQAVGFVAFPLANAISIQGFTLVIAAVLGSVAVVRFSTMRTLARVSFQISNMLSCTVWPELSRAFGEGNVPLARSLHRRAYQAGLALSLASSSVLWFLGPMIYKIWIRNSVNFDINSFHILLFVSFVNSLWFISSVVPMSTNTHHRITLGFVALSSISLGFGFSPVKQWGLMGAAIALLVIDVPMTYLVLRTSLLQLHESLGDFIQGILTPFASHQSIGPPAVSPYTRRRQKTKQTLKRLGASRLKFKQHFAWDIFVTQIAHAHEQSLLSQN